MKLAEYLDETKLRDRVNCGLVNVRRHNTLPLSIYCYSRKAVYGRVWDEITTKTRGLIVADDRTIISRPYEKFFAYNTDGQSETYPRSVENIEEEFGPPIITEKVNGCLGIFWKYGTHWGMASKGSFHSPHAEFATKWLENHVEQYGKLVFPEGYTPVFEIVCQKIQPHVIKYPSDGLVLLDFIKVETGEERDRIATGIYAIKNWLIYPKAYNFSLQEVLRDDSDKFEGYVATYNRPGNTPLKLKIKFPTFLKNRKIFYENLRNTTVRAVEEKNNTEAKRIVQEALVHCTTRKEFAEYFNRPEHKEFAVICFKILDYDKEKHDRRSERSGESRTVEVEVH